MRRSSSCPATRTARAASPSASMPDRPRQVNDHRGLLGFTGTYRGTPVSVQTSGMGTPSMSIVAEELLRLGAKRLIRVGTCGGIASGLKTGDLVIATAACPVDGATATYLHGEPYAPAADFGADARPGRRGRCGRHPGPDRARRIGRRLLQHRCRLRDTLARARRARLRDGGLGALLPRGSRRRAGRLRAHRQRRPVGGGHDRGELPAARGARPGHRSHDRRGARGRNRRLTLPGWHRSCGRLESNHDRYALARRRQPGRRHHQPQRRGRGAGLPAAQGHRPRRVLGRQRQAGGALLPRAVGLHAGGLRRASRPACAIGPAS